MDERIIEGVKLIKLKQIFHPQGNVYHGMKKSDIGFLNFGEAYFSTIKYGETKPWKKHLKMTLNLIVPEGEIKFVLFDDRQESITVNQFMEVTLSIQNYFRLTIPPNVWLAFQGVGKENNLLLNVADIEHDPNEIIRLKLNEIRYDWLKK